MTVSVIPLLAANNQTFTVQLGAQNCQINVYQKSTGMFLDLYINNVLLLGGILCHNMVRLIRDGYFGFVGELAFTDTQGTLDPWASGLGTRFKLLYIT